jgi:hypothetical protein
MSVPMIQQLPQQDLANLSARKEKKRKNNYRINIAFLLVKQQYQVVYLLRYC